MIGLVVGVLMSTAVAGDRAPASVSSEADARVVFHADFSDPRRFSAMLSSLGNLVAHYENEFMDADVRVVVVSHAIRFMTENDLADTPFAADDVLLEARPTLLGRMRSMAELNGVQFELCDITRAFVNLPEDELAEFVTLVPSGVVRIAELQNDYGFAYLKIE
ncbi:MAG: DsrE family protein [Thioalkalivibrionaceae bacterium]